MRTVICICAATLAALPAFGQASTRPRVASAVSIGKGTYLGIGVADIDAERAKELKLREERGVEIKSVEGNGPADKAGLKVGDVILEYNGQRVEGIDQLIRMVRETPAGRDCTLSIIRNGAAQTIKAKLGERNTRVIGSGNWEIEMPEMPPMPPMPPMSGFERWSSTSTSTLGIECETLGGQLAEFFGVKEGALVRSVTKNSPADKAGIKAGDVIVKIDSASVSGARELSSAVRGAREKKTIPIVLVREKKETTVTVTLESGRYRGRLRPAALRARYC